MKKGILRDMRRGVFLLFISFCFSFFLFFLPSSSLCSEWKGVDETVIENVAEEHGRAASAPVLDTDRGDILLFMFLIAGVAGGFAAGYFYRMLSAGKARGKENGKKD